MANSRPRTRLTDRLIGSKTFDFPSVAAGANTDTTVTVRGAVPGDFALASVEVSLGIDAYLDAHVTAVDTVTVILTNDGAAALDLASTTLRATVFPRD